MVHPGHLEAHVKKHQNTNIPNAQVPQLMPFGFPSSVRGLLPHPAFASFRHKIPIPGHRFPTYRWTPPPSWRPPPSWKHDWYWEWRGVLSICAKQMSDTTSANLKDIIYVNHMHHMCELWWKANSKSLNKSSEKMSSIIAWFCRKEDLWFGHFSVALSDLYQFTLKQDLNQLIVCHPVITGGAWYLFNALFQMNVVMRWTLSWFCVLFQIKPIFTMTNERWLHRSHSHPIHRLSAEVLEIIFQKVIYYPKKGFVTDFGSV